MITLQYLESSPHLADLSDALIADKLSMALEILSLDNLLLGWDLPHQFIETCRRIADRYQVKLYRWQPILTGDGMIFPRKEWQVRNLEGFPLSGYRHLPEFTFICPNHPQAREAILSHLGDLTQSGLFDGVFLDRMRFPSPTENPIHALTCFCEHCQLAAADQKLDLIEIRQFLQFSPPLSVLPVLCGATSSPLSPFLDFRQQTITGFISEAVEIIRSAELEVGLDCFSPCLTRMVGQDLKTLAPLADWTKLMIYGHACGPATLPFEINALCRWLIGQKTMTESAAMSQIAEWIGLPLPESLVALIKTGISPEALSIEYSRSQHSGVSGLFLAGIELVEIPDISELNSVQIETDLLALKSAGAKGLSLSWDLWHIPLERLQLVHDTWFSSEL